jgi:hypothetical protein
MTKKFTPDDLLRYMYGETTSAESETIELLINTDEQYRQSYQQWLTISNDICELSKIPSENSIDKILKFSHAYDFHSV